MNQEIKVLIQVKSRHQRDILSALLTAMPGVQILQTGHLNSIASDGTFTPTPDILFFEDSQSPSERAIVLSAARARWPKLKTVVLVDSTSPNDKSRLDEVDLILPIDATAGELIKSIGRLAGQETVQNISHYLMI